MGGNGEAGSGGAPLDCPAQPGSFTYSCAEIVSAWTPTFDSNTGRYELHVDDLEFPIVSGTLNYFYEDSEPNVGCGTGAVTGEGTTAVMTAELQFFNPSVGRITAFDLVDACGSHHVFDQTGVACNELRGGGFDGVFALTCFQPAVNCPGECE